MSETIEPREFVFSWKEDGAEKTTKISADSYAEACWWLGFFHGRCFKNERDIPNDFKLELKDQPPATR
jgi:hypothetical protein